MFSKKKLDIDKYVEECLRKINNETEVSNAFDSIIFRDRVVSVTFQNLYYFFDS